MNPPLVDSAQHASPPAMLGEALSLMPDGAVELNARGDALAANANALTLFGCSREELADRLGEFLPGLSELLARGATGRWQRLEARRASGVPVLVDVNLRRVASRTLCVVREIDDVALLGESQRYFDVAFDNAPIGMALFNTGGEYVRVNAALCELLGRSEADLLGRRDQELTHPDDRQADLDAAWEILAGNVGVHQCEKRFLRPDGSIVWALANLTFLRDESGRPLSWVGQFQDITARRAAEEALRDAEERFRMAFDHAPIGLALVAPEGRWLRVNATLVEMLGYSEAELLATSFQDITHPEDLDADLEHVRAMLAGDIRTYEMEKRYVRADGSILWILLSVSLVRDDHGRPLYFISQVQDIDDRKRAHAELQRLAHRDALTGTLNRRAWDEELERAILRAREDSTPLAVAMIDLNDFKGVNDRSGHDAGDQLLQAAARAWQLQLRSGDVLARLGGDEFAVLLPGCGAEDVDAIVPRLKGALPHTSGCEIGVAIHRAGESPREFVRRADAALYTDKARRRTKP